MTGVPGIVRQAATRPDDGFAGAVRWRQARPPPRAGAVRRGIAGLAGGALALLGLPAAAERTAEANYLIHCAGCHRIDGRGFGTEVPDFTAELSAMLRVPGGREYLVQVPGASQAPISDRELAAVINLLIARFAPEAFARGVPPMDEAEVARHRARRPLDIVEERRRLLRLIAELADGA